MKKCVSAYDYLSGYRSEVMGIAILWVVWFHSWFTFGGLPIGIAGKALVLLKETGYGGVDIFLFVSGLGIYHSLQKHDISVYFKNRLKKILPVWWTYLIGLIAVRNFVLHEAFLKTEIAGFATFTGYWLGLEHQGNWYVYGLMLLYMISPVLFCLIETGRNKEKVCIAIMCIALAASAASFGRDQLIFFSRIPVYILGMTFAAVWKERKMTRTKWIICFFVLVMGIGFLLFCLRRLNGYLLPYGLYWYPFILIAPTVSLWIGKVFEMFPAITKPLRFVLGKAGKASLEILLATDFLFPNIYKVISIGKFTRLIHLAIMIAGILIGFLFHAVVEYGKKLCGRLYRRIAAGAAAHAGVSE